MIRLALLLLGAPAVRPLWGLLLVLGLVWIGLGLWLLADLNSPEVVYAEDILAVFIGIEGAVLLAAGVVMGLRRHWGEAVRGLIFLFVAFLVYNVEWDRNIGSVIVFGLAFMADGILRIASALVLRGRRLITGLLTGGVSLVLATMILTRGPLPYSVTVPFCIALLFVYSGTVMLRAGWQLRRLSDGESITSLPLYAAANWQARGVSVPRLDPAAAHPASGMLNVRVWTAAGSAEDPARRPIIDRYVAAVDRKGVVSTGHAALELEPDLYISHYPDVEIDHSPDDLLNILNSGAKNDVPGKFQPSLAVEAADWCMPDQTVTFRRFNEAALRAFWAVYSRDKIYNLSARNCSTTVALALDAATEGLASTDRPVRDFIGLMLNPEFWMLRLVRGRAEGMTWTPGLVLDYSRLLRQVLEHGHRRWRDRLVSALAERHEEVA